MPTTRAKLWDMLGLLRHGGPGLCNIAVTNSCNATCDFCNFANGKIARKDLRWMDVSQCSAALDILYRRGIRYVSFFGGEPLLHPHLAEMIRLADMNGMGSALITNGWLLPSKLEELYSAGLKTIYISIDAASIHAHETNRGLKNLVGRIRVATSRTRELGITTLAQVTISKLISDYQVLGTFLRDLGFEAVAFSYPQRVRLGSTSLAWSDTSKLVNFTDGELSSAFTSADTLRSTFPVCNPSVSMADMKRHLLGEEEHFVCYGGYKSFYLDWNFNVWRCDMWGEPMCSVWEFEKAPLVRDGCKACIADCYRDSSVMLHFAVSLGDTLDRVREGKFFSALKLIANQRNMESLSSILQTSSIRFRLARLGKS